MLLKFIFSLFFVSIIHPEIITDEPSLIFYEKGKYKTKYIPHNIDRYISQLETNIKYVLTRNKELFLKYCTKKFCLDLIELSEFTDSQIFPDYNFTINKTQYANVTFMEFKTTRTNLTENGVIFSYYKTENIGKIIHQYDITKKLVCNKINGNKCKIVYGKSNRKLFESEIYYIFETILKIANNKLVKELNDY